MRIAADYTYCKEKKQKFSKDGSVEEKIAAVQELGRLSSNANFRIDDQNYYIV